MSRVFVPATCGISEFEAQKDDRLSEASIQDMNVVILMGALSVDRGGFQQAVKIPATIHTLTPDEDGQYRFEGSVLQHLDFTPDSVIKGILLNGYWKDIDRKLSVTAPSLTRAHRILTAYFMSYTDPLSFELATQDFSEPPTPHPRILPYHLQ